MTKNTLFKSNFNQFSVVKKSPFFPFFIFGFINISFYLICFFMKVINQFKEDELCQKEMTLILY